jgi:hypothetical protein
MDEFPAHERLIKRLTGWCIDRLAELQPSKAATYRQLATKWKKP